MSHQRKGPLFWSPRILSIAFAVFTSIFALDAFAGPGGFWRAALTFTTHLLPSAVVVAILAAAWRWELLGVLLFGLMGGIYARQFLLLHPVAVAAISGPLLLIACLFLADWLAHHRSGARVAH
jgi:hypothetical protein